MRARFARLVVAVAAAALLSPAVASALWGGEYTTATGETVRVFASDTYPRDDAANQRWADYLASLLHGPELARVTVIIAPIAEVRRTCGFAAIACYDALRERIYAPGEEVVDGKPARAILAHEYGHHVARNRENTPWDAGDWGTKRWASYINVCSRAASGKLFPGGPTWRYELDPAEAFAEAYRVLNQRRLGEPEIAWDIVDESLYPDDTALRLLEEDVVSPWTTNTSSMLTGSFRAGPAAVRSFVVSTPYDGMLDLRLRAPGQLGLELTVFDLSGRRLLARAPAGTRTVAARICGHRSVRVRVKRTRGAGAFSLAVSKP